MPADKAAVPAPMLDPIVLPELQAGDGYDLEPSASLEAFAFEGISTDAVPLEQALIATGFAYDAAIRGEQGAVVARLLPKVRDIRRLGTASLDLVGVAAGRLNGFYERTLNPWDHAAGERIAREAGAVVKGRGAASPSREFLITGHPDVVGPLEELLDELGA
jgi:myo-inositol-1(or 4)-monophosphatase